MIEGFQAEYLLEDRGYDTDAIILKAVDEGMIPVIPPRKSRKHPRKYDKYFYKLRHLLRTLSCFSKDGSVLRLATLKMPLLSLLLSKYVVLLFGSFFIDDTVQKALRFTVLKIEQIYDKMKDIKKIGMMVPSL